MILMTLGLALVLLWFIGMTRRRTRQMSRLAHRLRLHFSSRDTFSLQEELAGLHLFQQGHAARLCNLVHGRRKGYRLVAGDYYFETGAGSGRTNRRYSLVAVNLTTGTSTYPDLVALRRPEGFLPVGSCRLYRPCPTGDPASGQPYALFIHQATPASTVPHELCLPQGVDGEISNQWLVLYKEESLGPLDMAKLIQQAGHCHRSLRSYAPALNS